MTTLVTGAAGFVGAVTAGALARAGHDVHAVVRPGTSVRRLEAVGSPAVVHRADLTDTAALAAVVADVRPTFVVHAAAAGGHGVAGRTLLWRDTVQATVSLLDALDPTPPARLVHVGSSMEYATSPRPLCEDDRRLPTTARGVAKLAAWHAVRQWAAERRVEATNLRLFRVYGADEPPGRLLPAILRALDDGVPVPLPAGQVGRDWVHVEDVAEACVRAATHATVVPVLNVGTGTSLPPAAVVDAFAAAAGRPVPVSPDAWPPTDRDVAHWCADLTVLREAWDWAPPTDLHEGARLTLEAHRATTGVRA